MTRRGPAAGDCAEAALGRLFADHHRKLLAYAMRRGASSEEAQDVLGDTFLVVWRRIRDIPGDGSMELPWLYGVAARVLLNHRRSRRRSTALVARMRWAAAIAKPGEEVDGTDFREVVTAMKRLRPSEQEVLRLSAWEELTAREVAATLGCTENAAMIRLYRARQRLRREIAKERRSAGHLRGRPTSNNRRFSDD